MPVAEVQKAINGTGGGQTTVTTTLSATVAGNFLVAYVGNASGAAMTMPAGWIAVGSPVTVASLWTQYFYYPNAPSTTSVLATSAAGGGSSNILALWEFSGMPTVIGIDTGAATSATGSGTALSTTANALQMPVELVLFGFADDNTFAHLTAGTGMDDNQIRDSFTSSTFSLGSGYKLSSGVAALTATMTGGSGNWLAQTIAFHTVGVARVPVGTASSATGSAVTTLALTLATAIPQGSTVVVALFSSSSTASGISLADASGNAYTNPANAEPSLPSSTGVLTVFYADNALALAVGDTITATFPSSTNAELLVSYLTVTGLPSFIVAANASGTSTSPASGVPSTTSANAIAAGGMTVGFVAFSNASSITETFTPGSGYTAGQLVQATGSSKTTGIQEEYANAAGLPATAGGTLGHSDTWAAVALHFRPANTWFYDYESGSDVNASGDSFAVLANGTDGVGNATTTFTSATGAFDANYVGRRINISKTGGNVQQVYLIQSVTNGTTLVLNGSPASNTAYTWYVGGAFKTIKYGGNVGQNSQTTQNSGSGFLGTSMGIVAGDTLRLKADGGPQDTGKTAVWTSNTNAATPTTNSKKITLNAAVNLDITVCDTAWTASANVTSTADTGTFMEGTKSAKHVVASAFTTGLASFFATGTLDLSSYQQVCFWINTTVAIAASQYSLRLCSDTAGVTTVNTIAIPAIPSTSGWVPVLVNNGGALGASIQSVALYVDSDQGAVTIQLDNIFAVPAPGVTALSLMSLVGKNAGAEAAYWWPVRSISGTTVTLDTGIPTGNQTLRGYYGVSETVELWKREPIPMTLAASNQAECAISSAGTLINAGPVNFIISGGWDRTAMSSQSGTTWFNFQNGVQTGVTLSANYEKVDQVGIIRAATGINFNSNTTNFGGSLFAVACSTGFAFSATAGNEGTSAIALACASGMTMNGSVSYWGTLAALSCSNSGLTYQSLGSNTIIGSITCCNNGTHGLTSAGGRVQINNAGAFSYNGGSGITAPGANSDCRILVRGAPTFAGNGTNSVAATNGSTVIVENGTTSDGTAQLAAGVDDHVIWDRFGGTATDFRSYSGQGTILSDTSTRHTASGVSWSLAPTSLVNAHALCPLRLKIASIACTASEARTVTAYLRRNAGGISAQLCIPGGQLAGMAVTDAVASVAGVNAWEQLTLTFTPTTTGVVDVYAQAWGGTTLKAWVDDVAVT